MRKNSGAAVQVLASFHTLLTGLIAFLYKSEKVSSHTWSPHCVTDFRKDLIFQGKALKSTSDKVKITKKKKEKQKIITVSFTLEVFEISRFSSEEQD